MIKKEFTFKDLNSYDILVAGGGSAGVASAISAARAGAKTLLVEKNSFLGGVATGALVTPMMKNALDAKNVLTKGIYLEVCEKLNKSSGGAKFKDGNPGWFNPEIYKIVLDEICIESNVNLIFETNIIGVEKENNILKSVQIFNKSGFYSIESKEFIDCTGDGDLIKFGNISYDEGICGKRQAMSLRFMMAGINIKKIADWLKENDKTGDSPVYELDNGDILLSSAFTYEREWVLKPFFDEALKNGDLKKEDANYFQIFSIPSSPGLVAFNCPRIMPKDKSLNPLNFEDTNFVLIEGRQMIKRISFFCKKYLPGFENSFICQIAPYIGVRESRRLSGQYILSKEDILSGAKFEDSVANSNWPIDIHPSNETEKSQLRHPPKGDFYQIPLRSLLPKENECKNLIVAGRLLSATFEAQGSARIQPNCYAMGETAGLLAAKRIKSTTLLS